MFFCYPLRLLPVLLKFFFDSAPTNRHIQPPSNGTFSSPFVSSCPSAVTGTNPLSQLIEPLMVLANPERVEAYKNPVALGTPLRFSPEHPAVHLRVKHSPVFRL